MSSPGRDPAVAEPFEDTITRATVLYAEHRYTEALELIFAAGEVPAGWAAIRTLLEANLRCMFEPRERAIEVLEAGIHRGEWWRPDPLLADPDFDPIRPDPRFGAVVRESAARAERADATAKPSLRILEPARPDGSVLLALHGGSGNADEFAPRWAAATGLGTVVAAPQSPLAACSGGERFTWPSPPETAEQLRVHLGEIRAGRSVDRLVLGGFSRGARMALWCALHAEPELAAGVIAVAGAPPVEEVAPLLPAAAGRGLRAWFVTGEADFAAAAVRAAHAAFEEAGIECRLTVTDGAGHAFPAGFDELLPEMLSFVLGE
jgi:predicted esterase